MYMVMRSNMAWANIFQKMIQEDKHKKTITEKWRDFDKKSEEFNKKFWENY